MGDPSLSTLEYAVYTNSSKTTEEVKSNIEEMVQKKRDRDLSLAALSEFDPLLESIKKYLGFSGSCRDNTENRGVQCKDRAVYCAVSPETKKCEISDSITYEMDVMKDYFTANVLDNRLIISENSASGGDGGGIYFGKAKGDNVLQTVVINNNTALTGGGVLINQCESMKFDGVQINNNKALRGGGLAIDASTRAIIFKATPGSSKLSGNEANDVGGNLLIYGVNDFGGSGEAPIQTISTSRDGNGFETTSIPRDEYFLIEDGKARYGGGIAIGTMGDRAVPQVWAVMFENINIARNDAQEGGGGLLVNNTEVFMENAMIDSNEALVGGGLQLIGNAARITREQKNGDAPFFEITNNKAKAYGGGVAIVMDSTSSFKHLQDAFVGGNTAEKGGAGIYFNGGEPTIESCTVTENVIEETSIEGMGAGLFVDSNTVVTIVDVLVEKNKNRAGPDGGRGGGAFLSSLSELNFAKGLNDDAKYGNFIFDGAYASNFTLNEAYEGGAIYVNSGTIRPKESESNSDMLLLNDNRGTHGGNIFVSCTDGRDASSTLSNENGKEVRINNVESRGARKPAASTKDSQGGGLYAAKGSRLSLEASKFISNIASFGGALFLSAFTQINMKSVEVKENNALSTRSPRGAGIYIDKASGVDMEDVVISQNEAWSVSWMGKDSTTSNERQYQESECKGRNGNRHYNDYAITRYGLFTGCKKSAGYGVDEDSLSFGGGIFLNNVSTNVLITHNVEVKGNKAAVGGGVHVENSNTALGNLITSNN